MMTYDSILYAILYAPEHKAARKHAAKIKWDTDAAYEYAYALLNECNMTTAAAALKATHDSKIERDEAQFEEPA